jgi:hypothetical protein
MDVPRRLGGGETRQGDEAGCEQSQEDATVHRQTPHQIAPHPALSPEGRGQEWGDGLPGDQIFQPAIQSISLEPAGFMPCLVETTSSGLTVTKS